MLALTTLALSAGLLVGATPASAADAAPGERLLQTLTDSADRQAQLVQGEDARLIDVRVAGAEQAVTSGPRAPYRVRSAGLYTLVLPARKNAYTMDDLRTLAPQTFLKQRDGSYLLREHIIVDSGATLAFSPARPTTIKLLSSAQGFVSIVSRGGRIRILGSAAAPLKFTSWDDTYSRPDTSVSDGRAYILGMGQLVVRHTDFERLGFWSGRTGGLALTSTGSRNTAMDYASDDAQNQSSGSTGSRQTEVLPAGDLPAGDDSIDSVVGEVTDVKIVGNAFGFFVTGSSGIKMRNVTISDSLVDGLILHRSVTSADIEQVRVERSGEDGIVVTRGVEGALLTQVTSTYNGRDGVVITGRALADGPSPSGAAVRQFGNNVLTASLVEKNGRTGVRIIGGTQVRLLGNSITGGTQGILVTTGASGVIIDANRVSEVDGNGIQIRDSKDIEVSGNSVRRADTGLHVSDAQVQIDDNTVASTDLHAVSLIGDVTGTTLTTNLLGGSGSSAIDLARRVSGSEPVLKDNDLSGWKKTITQDGVLSQLKHPLTLVWLGVILLLIVGQIRVRGQLQPKTPYRDGPAKNQSTASIEADQQLALAAVGDSSRDLRADPPTAAENEAWLREVRTT